MDTSSDDERITPWMASSVSSTIRVSDLKVYVHEPSRDSHSDLAVVVVHQCTALGGCADAASDIASALCHEGLLTVSFDLRGAGDSRGCCCMWPIPCVSGCPEVSDVVTICRWVKEKYGRDTFICGVSAGGPVGAGAVGALLVQAIATAQGGVWVKPTPAGYNT